MAAGKRVEARRAVRVNLAPVVAQAQLRILEQGIGAAEILKHSGRGGITRVAIGVIALGKPSEGALDVVWRGRARKAKDRIGITHLS